MLLEKLQSFNMNVLFQNVQQPQAWNDKLLPNH